jgi:hypothetical protein
MPGGSVSLTVVTPKVAAEPEFATFRVQVAFVPAVKLPTCDLVIERFGTAAGITMVGFEARSPDGSLSPGVLTVAKFVTPGTAASPTATVTSNDELAPTPIEPGRMAVTICPFTLKLQPVPVPETNVIPGGSVSSTVVVAKVGADPEFVTANVHVPLVPAVKLPTCDFTSDRLGTAAGLTTVASEARLPAGSTSPGVLAVAEFVTPGIAPAPTATVRSNAELPPTAIEARRIAVTTWPLALKLQPDPEPETYVMPGGSVSRTVVVANVGAEPELATVIVQMPFVPAAKLPACVFVTNRFGTAAGLTTVGSEARSFEASRSFGVLTLAEFVTPGTAAPPTATVRSNDRLAVVAIEARWIAVTTGPFTLKLQPVPAADT